MNKIITIVTPSLNQGQYLEQAIYSVLSQAGDFFIDYIIADGGSTDSSLKIIKEYENRIKNSLYPINCRGIELRWWSKRDNGQSDALNQGFRIAKGDILAWINSDDYYAKNAFSIVSKKFSESGDVDLIYGNCFEVFSEEGIIKRGEAIQGDFSKFVQEGCLISQPAAFFTKRILERVGYLDESLSYAMDYDLWLKILKHSQGLFIDADLAYFRIWPESKTYKNQNLFRKEEMMLMKKYGGSLVNPQHVHRLRMMMPFLNAYKQKNLKSYLFFKKMIYKLINLIHY